MPARVSSPTVPTFSLKASLARWPGFDRNFCLNSRPPPKPQQPRSKLQLKPVRSGAISRFNLTVGQNAGANLDEQTVRAEVGSFTLSLKGIEAMASPRRKIRIWA
jgi:hypothetical protein